MKKLIAVDVDGTLINDERKITEKTRMALIEAQKQGHKVVIASGRSPKGVYDLAKELEMDVHESYISNQNGTIITDMKTKEVVIEHHLDIELAKEILQFSESLDIDYMIYHKDKVYSNKKETYKLDEVIEKNYDVEVIIDPDLSTNLNFEPYNILFSQEPDRIVEPAKIIEEKYGSISNTMFSSPYYFELMPAGVTKGSSLVEIANYLGIDQKDIIAFGDHQNDMSMIEMAGVGIAMGNAIDELKNIADEITLTNNQDGIAEYLNNNILLK